MGALGAATARICVCGLYEMPEMVERLRPRHLISLLPAEEQPPTPSLVSASAHLRVLVDDVDDPGPGVSAPSARHLDELIGFLRASSPEESIVIHCLASQASVAHLRRH